MPSFSPRASQSPNALEVTTVEVILSRQIYAVTECGLTLSAARPMTFMREHPKFSFLPNHKFPRNNWKHIDLFSVADRPRFNDVTGPALPGGLAEQHDLEASRPAVLVMGNFKAAGLAPLQNLHNGTI